MSELAATLPNTGGAVAFFAGDNDLATFGEQLVSFGASIKSYAQEVTGLDTDAVASSTVAGQTLVELANTLPNTGGLVAFFTGDNDLETFGEQLVPFGEAMKAYSDSVTGMDSAAVTASATAAKALAELQASLPNIGGVVDFFTGGNDLETFANGLLPFGEGMKAYADAVSGMDAGAVSRLYYRRPGPGRAPGISSPCGRGDELLYRGQRSWPVRQRGFSPSARP